MEVRLNPLLAGLAVAQEVRVNSRIYRAKRVGHPGVRQQSAQRGSGSGAGKKPLNTLPSDARRHRRASVS
jgi:hypothetical protein